MEDPEWAGYMDMVDCECCFFASPRDEDRLPLNKQHMFGRSFWSKIQNLAGGHWGAYHIRSPGYADELEGLKRLTIVAHEGPSAQSGEYINQLAETRIYKRSSRECEEDFPKSNTDIDFVTPSIMTRRMHALLGSIHKDLEKL
jgi:hypothetical protein